MGFSTNEIFEISNSGIKTDRDALFIDEEKEVLEKRIGKLVRNENDAQFNSKYRVINSGSYKLIDKLEGKFFNSEYVKRIQYRPFDYRWIYYDPGLISRSGYKVFRNFENKKNLGLLTKRQSRHNFSYVFVTGIFAESCVFESAYANNVVSPLYVYNFNGEAMLNLKKQIVDKICSKVGNCSPEEIFDYVYAILHSPTYREKYKEFLRIDFPRVPYPNDKEGFENLAKLGTELRQLHLLESPKVNEFITTFLETGSDIVEKVVYKNGNVYINEDQYFGKVPEVAWNFYIGGYQPTQKWLKDRKGQTLTNGDIEHYQKIIVVLSETDRIMKKIDQTILE